MPELWGVNPNTTLFIIPFLITLFLFMPLLVTLFGWLIDHVRLLQDVDFIWLFSYGVPIYFGLLCGIAFTVAWTVAKVFGT